MVDNFQVMMGKKLSNTTLVILLCILIGPQWSLVAGWTELNGQQLPILTQNELVRITYMVEDQTGSYKETVFETYSPKESRWLLQTNDGTGAYNFYYEYNLGWFKYKEYNCHSHTSWEKFSEDMGFEGSRIYRSIGKREPVAYGLIAVWLNINNHGSLCQIGGSSWLYNDEKNGTRWRISADPSSPSDQMRASDIRKIEQIRIPDFPNSHNFEPFTATILDVEYPRDDDLLQLPPGYGCRTTKHLGSSSRPPNSEYFHTKLEISATDMTNLQKGDSTNFATIEIIDKFDHSSSDLKMIRKRELDSNIKNVIDISQCISYKIDEKNGGCNITHFPCENEPTHSEELLKARTLSFSNGLKLPMNREMLELIFFSTDGFNMIIDHRTDHESHDFFEAQKQPTFKWLDDGQEIYITRKYKIINNFRELNAVTIRVLSEDFTKLLAIYNMRIIESWTDHRDETRSYGNSEFYLARQMDISQECYLESDDLELGRHYAWFRVTYESLVHSQMRDLTRQNQWDLMRVQLYDQILKRFTIEFNLNILRFPTLELTQDTEKSSLVLRFMIIDQAPYEYIFSPKEGYSFELDKSHDLPKSAATSVSGCADLCIRSHCRSFSFNVGTHECLLTMRRVNNFIAKVGSTTYVDERDCSQEDIAKALLISIKNILDQRNLDIKWPEIPSYLYEPRDRSVLSKEEYREQADLAWGELWKFAEERGQNSQLMLLRYSSRYDQEFFLLPEKYIMEQNSISELVDGQAGDNREHIRVSFGIAQQNVKYISSKIIDKDLGRIYEKISEDQCQIACFDSKCSSYSYCSSNSNNQECIITDIYEIGSNLTIKDDPIIEEITGCNIMRRDFINKFEKFTKTPRADNPRIRKKKVQDASECAHLCYAEPSFKCLAFDYCSNDDISKAECLLLDNRNIETSSSDSDSYRVIDCDHYSRSSLANFISKPFQEIQIEKLNKISSKQIDFSTADKCAERCEVEGDCDLFEICFPVDEKTLHPRCLLIKNQNDDTSERLIKDTDLIKSNHCHVHLLPPVALPQPSQLPDEPKSSGLTILGGFFLYLGVTLLTTLLGCGFILLKNNNPRFRRGLDRVHNMVPRIRRRLF